MISKFLLVNEIHEALLTGFHTGFCVRGGEMFCDAAIRDV